jgi:hypothetical protein
MELVTTTGPREALRMRIEVAPFETFAARGGAGVARKVEAVNAGTIRLYERTGMRVVQRLR